MTHFWKKAFVILLLVVGAVGCAGPYHRHHRWGHHRPWYYDSYDRGRYAPYPTPYDGRSWRNRGHRGHHDYHYDGH